jgi:hypothetical protein
MGFSFKFERGETVYLPFLTEQCCLAGFRRYSVKAFFRQLGQNLYDIGLEELIKEDFLFTETEKDQALADDDLGVIECINDRLGI